MTAVLQLAYAETVRLDRSQLDVLYQHLGAVGAERVVNQALEEIAVSLSRLERAYNEGRFEELRGTVHGLIALAQQIGMPLLARVARDVEELSTSHDAAAFGAALARLERIGEGSLLAVWDLQDMSV